jgi:hypothetical protein
MALLGYVLVFLLFPGLNSPEARTFLLALFQRLLHPSFSIPGLIAS